MSFRFNFSPPEDCDERKNENLVDQKLSLQCSSDECSVGQRTFMTPFKLHIEHNEIKVSSLKIGEIEVKYFVTSADKSRDRESDLIPGIYEGGMKIWECSFDLANYIHENNCIKKGDSVLELGCGGGIPGIIAYIKGATVTFQDFNAEVLEHFTIENTKLNTAEEDKPKLKKRCRYISGDWEDVYKKYYYDLTSEEKSEECTCDKTDQEESSEDYIMKCTDSACKLHKYLCHSHDVILTSETIYDKSNYKKFLELMKAALKPDGTIYLAAKIHYFGVGGGIVDFEESLKSDNTFEVVSVYRITEAVERQILVIKFKK